MKNVKINYESQLFAASKQKDALSTLPMKKLPLGEVTVERGWLRTQLDLMCEGITGRLPDFGPFFKSDRNGYLYPETESGWEEIPYWIRGFYPMAVLMFFFQHGEPQYFLR